ncbi:hypothetical protein [Planctobacterium marinum]|uniref:spermine/spermidine synthase domain-containing protein n=1 Tax=Planctobacterium marinum TaxID=1631968 RepID=UPI0030D9F97A
MSLHSPHQPVLPHLSALLLCFYYRQRPQKVTELGLGGGSLQRFFRYHFPLCEIRSIEYSARVIRLFEQWFWPAGSPCQIVQQDAQQAIKDVAAQDLLFIDLFAEQGSPDFVFSQAFYQDCCNALNPDGLMVINLLSASWLQSEQLLEILSELQLQFRILAVPGYQNKVIFAARQALPVLDFDSQLQQVARQYQLDLNAVVFMR